MQVTVPSSFNEDLKFIEEWLAKPKHDEDYMECAKIENRSDESIESIFMQWSLEEIRYYYGLMWHQSTPQSQAHFNEGQETWKKPIAGNIEDYLSIGTLVLTKNPKQKLMASSGESTIYDGLVSRF